MDGERVPIEKAVAIPTFIGSLLSFLATSTAIVFHIMFPPSRHFRHALIINLLVAGRSRRYDALLRWTVDLTWASRFHQQPQ